MSYSDSLGIGFVGAGFVTDDFHSETLRGIRHAHGAAVMNPTESKAEEVADTIRGFDGGDPTVYGGDAEEAIRAITRDEDVDALWLTDPNHTRVDTVRTIVEELQQGDAELDGIAIEKPLARYYHEAEEVIDLIESVDVNHAYLENQVYAPGVVRMRELLWEAGRDAGRPYLSRATEEHGGPHSAWFWDGEKHGAGVLNDMMCHSHKVTKFLLEDPEGQDLEPVAVNGDVTMLKWGRDGYAEELEEQWGVDYKNAPAEDYARATIFYESEDGDLLAAEAADSWCYVSSGIRLTMELLGPEYSGSVNTLESGTSMFLSDNIDSDGGYVVEKHAASQGMMPVLPEEATTYGYLGENREAVRAFRAGENAREDLYDGLEVVELCMMSYKAAEQGERLEFGKHDLDGYVPDAGKGEFKNGVAGIGVADD
jgi:predicted dehydrogenase